MPNQLKHIGGLQGLTRTVDLPQVIEVLKGQKVDVTKIDTIKWTGQRWHIKMMNEDFHRYAVFARLGFEEQDPADPNRATGGDLK